MTLAAKPIPRTTLAALTASLALSGCGKDEEEAAPAPPPAVTSSGASIKLRGDFTPPENASLEVTQMLALENGAVLARSGESEITGKMSVTLTEQHTIRFPDDGSRQIAVGEGGAELHTKLGDNPAEEESQPDPLAGKTVIAQADPDGQWIYKLAEGTEGTLPAGFASADLRSEQLYPEGFLTFGDSWKPEPAALAQLLGAGFQLRSGEIKLRLIAIKPLRGQNCAEITADIKADGVFRSAESRQDVTLRLKGRIFRSLHLYQDVEAELSGTMELRSKLGTEEVRIEGPAKFRRAATWSKPVPDES